MRRFTTELSLGIALTMAGCAPGLDRGLAQTPCDASASLNALSGAAPGTLPPPGTPVAGIARQGVAITSAVLARALHVTEVAAGRTADGTADVQLRVVSCSFTPVTLDASLNLLDAQGLALATIPAQRAVLAPFSPLVLRFQGMAPRAAGFMASIGEAR